MKKTIIFLLGLALTAGCNTTSKPVPELSPTIGYSSFDNARVVDIVPQETLRGSSDFHAFFENVNIGAHWNAARSDEVILRIMVVGGYTGITDAALRIDGEIIGLRRTQGVTEFEDNNYGKYMGQETSTRDFSTSLETVEKIIHSKHVWLQLLTPTGTIEATVMDDNGNVNDELNTIFNENCKGYRGLIRFMAAVKANSNPATP